MPAGTTPVPYDMRGLSNASDGGRWADLYPCTKGSSKRLEGSWCSTWTVAYRLAAAQALHNVPIKVTPPLIMFDLDC